MRASLPRPLFDTNLMFPTVSTEWYWLPYGFFGFPRLSTLHPLLAPLPPTETASLVSA